MRSWMGGIAVCTVGILGWLGVLPGYELGSPRVLAQTTSQEGISPEQISLFAKVVLELEPHRLEAQKQAEETTDRNAKDEIRRQFIRKATEIITGNGMTVSDYNRITLRLKGSDGEALKTQIEQEILTLQASSPQPTSLNSP
ncbi:MAG: DUF4168 domain-containing protein [Cyanobacteriota bacterium]|nr:DUF4168 domain-containing protein [Cyanobacteriota bacterium]